MSEEMNAHQLIAQADALLAENRAAEAFEAYDRALDIDSSDSSVLLRAGMALMQSGAMHEAYLYLEQAQHDAADNPEILRLMGAAALAGGQGDLARRALESCRGAGAEVTGDLLLDLASAAYWDLDVEGALGYAREAVELDAESEEAAQWVAKLEALEDDHAVAVDVARGHCRLGRFEMGARLFTVAFALGDSYEARLYGGRAMLAAGRVQDAAELLRAALDMNPNDAEAKQDLATVLLILDDIDVPAEPVVEQSAHRPVEPVEPQAAAPTPGPAYCRECGTKLRPASRFCPSCGTEIGGR